MEKQSSPVPARAVNLMFLLTAGFWFTQYSVTPYINDELGRMGATASFMGTVAAWYGITQTAVRVPLGMLADWHGRQKPYIMLGCALSAAGMLGYLLWYAPDSFKVMRAVAGLASASWVVSRFSAATSPTRKGPGASPN